MNILYTGCTAKQTDDNAHKRARVKRIDDSSIICNSLRKQGFNVERRKVRHGDDLSKYDLSIVGIGAFGSNNYSGDILNALYAINKSKRVLILHEDWKIHHTMNSFSKMLDDEILQKTLSKRWSSGQSFYGGVDDEKFDKEVIREEIKNINNGKYDSLIPAFDWGDKTIVRNIVKSNKIYNIDHTPYVLENWQIPEVAPIVKKHKKHMLASLVDHRSWVRKQKLNWQVDYFGAKSIKESQPLTSELAVFNKCNEYISILCPEYPHSGSGWFRSRYIYSAISKSILFCSHNDSKALGLEHKNVEQMDFIEIGKYANTQSEAIMSYKWSKKDFDNKITSIVEECQNT